MREGWVLMKITGLITGIANVSLLSSSSNLHLNNACFLFFSYRICIRPLISKCKALLLKYLCMTVRLGRVGPSGLGEGTFPRPASNSTHRLLLGDHSMPVISIHCLGTITALWHHPGPSVSSQPLFCYLR